MANKSKGTTTEPATDDKAAPKAAPVDAGPRERLKAFEDEKFGKDCVRMDGAVEKGSGSLYQTLSPEDRAHHTALEKLIVAHDKLDAAKAALVAAESEAADAEMAADA